MLGGSTREPLITVAWPSAHMGPMGLEGAVRLSMRKELAAIDDPAEREGRVRELTDAYQEHVTALNVARVFEIDDVIDPAETRTLIAAALAAAVQRQGELVARYGGEEFAVLLPDADSAQALATAQRLCAAVRALELEHQTSPVRHCVTVSVGVAATSDPTEALYPENSAATPGIAQLFEQADAALYQAKKAGRDRAELWMATAQSITLRRS